MSPRLRTVEPTNFGPALRTSGKGWLFSLLKTAQIWYPKGKRQGKKGGRNTESGGQSFPWRGPTGFNSPGIVNGMQLECFGPRENHLCAFCRQFWAIWAVSSVLQGGPTNCQISSNATEIMIPGSVRCIPLLLGLCLSARPKSVPGPWRGAPDACFALFCQWAQADQKLCVRLVQIGVPGARLQCSPSVVFIS